MNRKLKIVIAIADRRLLAFAGVIFRRILKPASRLFRSAFESKRIKQLMGVGVISTMLSVTAIPVGMPLGLTPNFSVSAQYVGETIITEKSVRVSLDHYTITQEFTAGHPGIDMATPIGNEVYPIMGGVVEDVLRERVAYGNHVLVNHGSGIKSLYAHLSQIKVKVGDKITKDTVVGLVGSTGRSTGPHLHLQIWQDEAWVNPKAFFEGYFGTKLEASR